MIAIVTDFGDSEYVGVMKGVIKSVNPKAEFVDLCNTISPQNIREGAWVLLTNYKYFPQGTVFLCVIDPGVGSARKPIVIESENYFFVGPDNGLMYPAAKNDSILRMLHIKYLEGAPVAPTFHGRDIFAKVAAMVDKDSYLDETGEFIKSIVRLNIGCSGKNGTVMRIDSFGNIITNLPKLAKKKYSVRLGRQKHTFALFRNYDDAPSGKPFLVEGSAKTLEISVKGGSAARELKVRAGDNIIVS